MTEQEWLECTDPTPMLECLQVNASDRKLRLFACGCCRINWHLLTDERSRKTLELEERKADRSVTDAELAILICDPDAPHDSPFFIHLPDAWDAASLASSDAAWDGARREVDPFEAGDVQRQSQATLLRCIFGNRFRHITIYPRWLTSSVVDLATSIYEGRAFDRLSILADALMDSGCNSDEIIAHCQCEGPHVRGCWVIDLILSKDR